MVKNYHMSSDIHQKLNFKINLSDPVTDVETELLMNV